MLEYVGLRSRGGAVPGDIFAALREFLKWMVDGWTADSAWPRRLTGTGSAGAGSSTASCYCGFSSIKKPWHLPSG
jgi:hypothetical protein